MRTRQRIEGTYGALLLLVLGLGAALACSGDSPTAPVQQPGPPPRVDPVTASFTEDNLPNSNSVLFTNRSTGASTFAWDFGDGTTSDEIDPLHEYDAVGVYAVTLTATGASASSQVVKQVQVGIDAAFSCVQVANREVKFVNETINGNLALWKFGDGSQSQGQSPVHKFRGSGGWVVELIATRADQQDSARAELTLDTGVFTCSDIGDG